MKSFFSTKELRNYLQNINPDESISLTFINEKLTYHDIIALRSAEKVCDIAIACLLNFHELRKNEREILQEIGIKVLFVPPKTLNQPCFVHAGTSGEEATIMLQVILNIMPLVVTAASTNILIRKILKNFLISFEGLFSLLEKEVPLEILSTNQKILRNALQEASKVAISKNEVDWKKFKETVSSVLAQNNAKLLFLDVYDAILFEKESDAKLGDWCFATAFIDEKEVKDAVSLKKP